MDDRSFMKPENKASDDNPERALIGRIVAEGLRDVPMPESINPLAASMRMTIREVKEGSAWLTFEIGRQFSQGAGVIQGGILAAMADYGMAFAAMSRIGDGSMVASVALTVNYLRAGPPGYYEVRAELDKSGSRFAFARAVVTDARGAVMATASSPLAVV
jgi:uncharacterized protein (TIGR00369 family)